MYKWPRWNSKGGKQKKVEDFVLALLDFTLRILYCYFTIILTVCYYSNPYTKN